MKVSRLTDFLTQKNNSTIKNHIDRQSKNALSLLDNLRKVQNISKFCKWGIIWGLKYKNHPNPLFIERKWLK